NGYTSYDMYMDRVEMDSSGVEAQNLINMLTTNHTYFMRETDHFDFFQKVVLPELKEKNSRTKDTRIWCAASSTGEEAYTLAMILKDFFAFDYQDWDTTVLATDISRKVLETAVKGIYKAEQVMTLPERWVKNNFKKIDGEFYQVKEELREKVIFRQFNLMDPLPFRKKLDVVFLRNVMIYFNEDTKRNLINRIYDFMEPGGYLFIGTTENIDRGATDFKYVMPSVFMK
ncbi:MAG: protein-glutamate O-methyltransferase CheR, partial [Lachnospira sp.]|nr:protein-glutamate O-methyltransferase CheR [Lachnospira sp.]